MVFYICYLDCCWVRLLTSFIASLILTRLPLPPHPLPIYTRVCVCGRRLLCDLAGCSTPLKIRETLISLVTLAQQVRIELVHVVQLLAAYVALPRVALAVTALVQEVQGLVGELDAAEEALQVSFSVQRDQVALRPGRCDDSRGVCHERGGLTQSRTVIIIVVIVITDGGVAVAGRRG